MTYGISSADIQQVISVIAKNQKIEKIILFGSRAKGNFRNGSDVDLSLKGNGININDVLDISIDIDNLSLPYKFDFVIYDRINEEALLEHINRVGIILFNR